MAATRADAAPGAAAGGDPATERHLLVLFGATGDLGRSKLLPAVWEIARDPARPPLAGVLGVGRSERTADDLRGMLADAVGDGREAAPERWRELVESVDYVAADVATDAGRAALGAAVDAARGRVGADRVAVYLAIPPEDYEAAIEALARIDALGEAQIALEKPIGTDAASARRVNAAIAGALGERRAHRVDHFLSKEPVDDLVALRAGSPALERLWSAEAVACVQIDMPEEGPLEDGRAAFYEQTGAIRDMLATHVLELAAVVGMEPPASLAEGAVAAARERFLAAARPLRAADVVRGQYEGYREAEGVDPRSDTETFAAARLMVDAPRWEGVPFLLRTGKGMHRKARRVTLLLRGGASDGGAERVVVDLGPETGVRVELGRGALVLEGDDSLAGAPGGIDYARVLERVLVGDERAFLGRGESQRAWELFAAPLAEPAPVRPYAIGAPGPAEAAAAADPWGWLLDAS